jgi:hypothetical protein
VTRTEHDPTLDYGHHNGDESDGDIQIGAVVDTGEHPILETPQQRHVAVTVNMSLAHDEDGAAAILVRIPNPITAAEAQQLIAHLAPAVRAISDVRQDLGYDQ